MDQTSGGSVLKSFLTPAGKKGDQREVGKKGGWSWISSFGPWRALVNSVKRKGFGGKENLDSG